MYSDGQLPVRPIIADAHQAVLDSLTRSGRFLTSAQRIEVAHQVRVARDCLLCNERKASLSPYTVDGAHPDSGTLPAVLVDVAHRVATDPARLSPEWLNGLDVEVDLYLEVVGLTVEIVGMDTFARGIGAAPVELPEWGAGEPSRQKVAGGVEAGAWVPMVPRNGVPNVGRALSLAPEENARVAQLSKAHYVPPKHIKNMGYDPGRAISRTQMELVAGRVSKLNGCFY